nr:hypothetical protein [Tanacetum cinerariifolium]
METKSSSAEDKSVSHPLPPTSVVSKMHKEAQQAASGPTSLWATSEEGAHPQLSSDSIGSNLSVLIDKIKSAEDGLKTSHTNSSANKESRTDDISLKVKLEDLSYILKDTRSAFFTPDSPLDEPIIISDESEKEVARDKDIEATSHDVTDTLNRFSTMVKNASGATSMNVPSVGKATASPTKGDKNTKDANTNLKDELVDLLGKYVVTRYYTKMLLFDKYCDKMLKRKKSPKITKCEVLTKKGPIRLKIYREHSTSSPSKIGKYLHFSLCSGIETEEGPWLERQSSLVDNSKLNVVYLLNRSWNMLFHF